MPHRVRSAPNSFHPRGNHSAICRSILLRLALLLAALHSCAANAAPVARPNVVLIFCDDMGYADVSCYGAKGYQTPNIDRLARQGVRFTDFYVAQAVCSASRAALMTGCYPNRIGIKGALGPQSRIGIHSNETTIAELLRAQGYATAIFGKWHLGHHSEFLPTHHGFDEYFGLPYSNDMWPHHPTTPTNYPPLPLIEGEKTIQVMPDQTQLTTGYTERAVGFIERNRERPFFLYVPHNMPHVPLHASAKFSGRTRRGLYGDVIAEIDWSVGQILAALKKHGLEKNTLVLFTSDNGPWLSYGDHAGSAGRLREGKGTVFEGGVRVPFIARWPGRIPAATVCHEPAMTIDVLPTIARIADVETPSHKIDGLDIWPLLSGKRGAKSLHAALCFYWDDGLEAIRSGRWKLHFPHDYVKPLPTGNGGQPGTITRPKIDLALFNLESDPSESRDVARRHPEVVERLQRLAERARADLGDSLTKVKGAGIRAPGRMAAATEQVQP
jgi:arylsulfatase A